jgi:cyanophycinase
MRRALVNRGCFVVFLLALGIAWAQADEAPEYGPENGTLVIAGGGNLAGTGIMETFLNLAGGASAKIIVVPTNGGNKDKEGKWIVYKEQEVIAPWVKLGATNVHMLHTHDRAEADTEEFAKTLRDAKGVWFNGGRQWNCVDSYMNTLTLREFRNVLARGGVIGGSSAGATIQGDYLVRGAVAGPNIMMTPEPEHEHGFRFLRRSAIDQHINTRNRWDDLGEVMKKYPPFLGIGLSEGTAIIVNKDVFRVMGKWKVAIWDNTHPREPWEKPFFVLQAGDVYNMKTRSVVKYGIGDDKPVTVEAK